MAKKKPTIVEGTVCYATINDGQITAMVLSRTGDYVVLQELGMEDEGNEYEVHVDNVDLV